MNSEPALTIGSVVAAIEAGIALVVVYGFQVSDAQKGAIIAFTVAVATLVGAVLTRMHVFAPTTVDKIVAAKGSASASGNGSLGAGGVTLETLGMTATANGAHGRDHAGGDWLLPLMTQLVDLARDNGRLQGRQGNGATAHAAGEKVTAT